MDRIVITIPQTECGTNRCSKDCMFLGFNGASRQCIVLADIKDDPNDLIGHPGPKCNGPGKYYLASINEINIGDKVRERLNKIKYWTDENGLYNTEDAVDLSDMELTSLPVKFGYVGGNFYCYNNNLQTLEGAPEKVGGGFDCSYNNLQTLEGAPGKVEGDFDCSYNNLQTLEGAPREVGGSFWCYNNRLQTLEGAPREVRGDFIANANPISCSEVKRFTENASLAIGGKIYLSMDFL